MVRVRVGIRLQLVRFGSPSSSCRNTRTSSPTLIRGAPLNIKMEGKNFSLVVQVFVLFLLPPKIFFFKFNLFFCLSSFLNFVHNLFVCLFLVVIVVVVVVFFFFLPRLFPPYFYLPSGSCFFFPKKNPP